MLLIYYHFFLHTTKVYSTISSVQDVIHVGIFRGHRTRGGFNLFLDWGTHNEEFGEIRELHRVRGPPDY